MIDSDKIVAIDSEEEFVAAGGRIESETEAETNTGLDEGAAEIISTVAAGLVMLCIPIALIPLVFVKKKKRRK